MSPSIERRADLRGHIKNEKHYFFLSTLGKNNPTFSKTPYAFKHIFTWPEKYYASEI